jgi:hypothetical protein
MTGRRRKPGRMGPFIEGYRAWLVGLGYTPETIKNMLAMVGDLGPPVRGGGRDGTIGIPSDGCARGVVRWPAPRSGVRAARSDSHRVPSVAGRAVGVLAAELGSVARVVRVRPVLPVLAGQAWGLVRGMPAVAAGLGSWSRGRRAMGTGAGDDAGVSDARLIVEQGHRTQVEEAGEQDQRCDSAHEK